MCNRFCMLMCDKSVFLVIIFCCTLSCYRFILYTSLCGNSKACLMPCQCLKYDKVLSSPKQTSKST